MYNALVPFFKYRVADPELGSGAFLTPGSWIWDGENRDLDPGSNHHILELKGSVR